MGSKLESHERLHWAVFAFNTSWFMLFQPQLLYILESLPPVTVSLRANVPEDGAEHGRPRRSRLRGSRARVITSPDLPLASCREF